jgi:archaeal preflagellin peptidase FlaK
VSPTVLLEVSAVVLVAGLAYASVRDLKDREVTDHLWQLLGATGALLGGIAVETGGLRPVLLWAVVVALALEHLVPWEDALGEGAEGLVLFLDLAAYAVAIGVVAGAAVRWGVGPRSVPIAVIAALASVVLARLLFELQVLYGGADAKALIVTGLLVPVLASPFVHFPPVDATLLSVLPFSLTLLTDAALFSVGVPVAIALRNAARGEFRFPGGFTGYTLEVAELPRRFVWVRDPSAGEDTFQADVETSEEDRQLRAEVAQRLEARGVKRVWVTPQLPFLVLLASGAVAGLLWGNLLLDLLSLL